MDKNKRLRSLLDSEKILALPGCYDGFSAKIIESMGFPALYMTGYGASASRLGKPDMGLITMHEMADLAGNIASTVDIPLISDADTGYGGLNNLARTVEAFERNGVSGIHLEDQVFPKKCGQMAGRACISQEAMVVKLKTAIAAKKDSNFVIIGRSDAKAAEGFDNVLKRLDAYINAGVDYVMIGERYSSVELQKLGKEFFGKLMISVGVIGWPELNEPMSVYAEMGVKIAVFPAPGIGAAGKAVYDVYKPLLDDGYISDETLPKLAWSNAKINEILQVEKYAEVENGLYGK